MADQELELLLTTLPLSGGVAELFMEYDRDLTLAEVETQRTYGALGMHGPNITKVRTIHHHAARLLGEGRPEAEVASITGYTVQRLWMLKQDPSFQELMAYYRSQKNAAYVDVHQRLAEVSLGAIDELRDRLDVAPEGFSNKSLMDLAVMGLDRTGVAPKSGTPSAPQVPALTINFVSPVPAQPLTIDGEIVKENHQ